MIGKIKRIMKEGYGWITCGDEEFFFHCSEFKGNFRELVLASPPNTESGPTVLFKAIEHPKGPRATKVELIKDYVE